MNQNTQKDQQNGKYNRHQSVVHDFCLHLIKAWNVFLITLPFVVCWMKCWSSTSFLPRTKLVDSFFCALFSGLYIIFGRIYDGFFVSFYKKGEMIYSQVLAILLSDVFSFSFVYISSTQCPKLLPSLLGLLSQLLLAVIWCVLANKWYLNQHQRKKTLILYDKQDYLEAAIHQSALKEKYKIVGKLPVSDVIHHRELLDEVDSVFLSDVHSEARNQLLKECFYRNIEVYVIPRVGDVMMSGGTYRHLLYLPMMQVRRYRPAVFYLLVKRSFDIVVSLLAIVFLFPLMLATAVAVKSDGGPVLYKQKRLTLDRKEFELWKFRSMRVDAEQDGVARLSVGEQDDRITKVGKVIRKVRIDELPQLFNILTGNMSIVGPRPERPEIAAQYEAQLPEFCLRLQVKAGLTGYAQVYGKYNSTPFDKLKMDLIYIARVGLLEDLRIMFATIKILFLPESTEGIAKGQSTALTTENSGFQDATPATEG